jgi:hypothetical protein
VSSFNGKPTASNPGTKCWSSEASIHDHISRVFTTSKVLSNSGHNIDPSYYSKALKQTKSKNMSGMEFVPVILCLFFPGVAANWFAAQARQATNEEAPRNSGAEFALPTTARSPNDDVSHQRTLASSTDSAVFHLSLEEEDTPCANPQRDQRESQRE